MEEKVEKVEKEKRQIKSFAAQQEEEASKPKAEDLIKPVDNSIKEKLKLMSKSGYGSSEPKLITLDLINQKIDEYKLENKILSRDISPEACEDLAMSFCGILQISNLDSLVSLKTLRLDNNMIMKIENLENLVNITWLDLSFNFISKIEGLKELVNLTDLSVYANQITEVTSGLDENRKLNVLSIGKNQIADIKETVSYLKRFNNLQALCVHFNPFCKEDDNNPKRMEEMDTEGKSQETFHTSYNIILQNLKHIKYLDWKPVDEELKKKAKSLASSAGKEEKEDVLAKEEQNRKDEAELRNADLGELIGFYKIIDAEINANVGEDKLKELMVIKGLKETLDNAETSINKAIEDFKEKSLLAYKGKKKCIEENLLTLEKNNQKFVEQSKELVRAFKRKFKEFKFAINNPNSPAYADREKSLEEIAKQIGLYKLKEDLFEIEVHLKLKNDAFIKTIKTRIEDDHDKKLGQLTENLKTALDSCKLNFKETITKCANKAKAIFEAYQENLQEGEKDEDNQPAQQMLIGNQQEENEEEKKQYFESIKSLFTGSSGGDLLGDIDKINEVFEDKLPKLKENLDNKRRDASSFLNVDLNNKEAIRSKKRIQDIDEIFKIYYEKIQEALDEANKVKNKY